jgi:ADP-ribose pyrophosphatase
MLEKPRALTLCEKLSKIQAIRLGAWTMEEFADLTERQLSTRNIYDGTILHVRVDEVSLPGGGRAPREYLRHIGAVCVLPLLEGGRVLIERQYRYPVGQVITEIPAGKLDAPDEDPELAARRELREETGAVADELVPLGLFYPACAYSDEAIHMYLARGIRFGERELDEDEFLNLAEVPLSELVEDVMAGRIPDAKTQIAVLKAARLLGAL